MIEKYNVPVAMFGGVTHHKTEPQMRVSFVAPDGREFDLEMSTGTAARMIGAVTADLQHAVIPKENPDLRDLSRGMEITKASCAVNDDGGNVTLKLVSVTGAVHQFELSPVASQSLLAGLQSSGIHSATIQKPQGKLN